MCFFFVNRCHVFTQQSVKARDSKFGVAMVIESTWQSGGYVLGFRIDPIEKLHSISKMIRNLRDVFASSPYYGVEFERSVETVNFIFLGCFCISKRYSSKEVRAAQ